MLAQAHYAECLKNSLHGELNSRGWRPGAINYVASCPAQVSSLLRFVSPHPGGFNVLMEYSEFEVENWLVNYVNKKENIKDTIHQVSIEYRDIQDKLFDIRVRKEVIVAPLRDYVEKWLKQALINITKENKENKVTNLTRIVTSKLEL
jgi:hypothetical protein